MVANRQHNARVHHDLLCRKHSWARQTPLKFSEVVVDVHFGDIFVNHTDLLIQPYEYKWTIRHFLPTLRCIWKCKYTVHWHFIDALSQQFHLSNYYIVNKMFVRVFVRSFVCFLALRPRPTANVLSGLSVILTLNKAFRTRERGRMSIQICILTELFNATTKHSVR